MRAPFAVAVLAALALASAGVAAQAAAPEADALPTATGADLASMAVPVWNSSSGKLEAVLWIDTSTLDDPAGAPALGTRWTSATGRFTGGLSAAAAPTLGLLCGGGTVDRLGDGCVVTELNRPALATTQLQARASTRIGRSEWTGYGGLRRSSTDSLLPGTSLAIQLPELVGLTGLPGLGIEQNDLGIVGELKLGEQGWIRVRGSVARARLMPASSASALPGTVAPRWNSRTLSVGGGYGALGGEVIGRVVNVPGDTADYGTLGLGLTWRTPWSARLTVGAQNLLSTGENPVAPRTSGEVREEGRVPYVRYQQDL